MGDPMEEPVENPASPGGKIGKFLFTTIAESSAKTKNSAFVLITSCLIMVLPSTMNMPGTEQQHGSKKASKLVWNLDAMKVGWVSSMSMGTVS